VRVYMRYLKRMDSSSCSYAFLSVAPLSTGFDDILSYVCYPLGLATGRHLARLLYNISDVFAWI